MYQEINLLPENFSRDYDRIQELILRKNNRLFSDAYDFCYGLLHYAISQKNPEILEHSDDFESLVSNRKILEILKDNMGLMDTKSFSELIYLNKIYNSKKTETGLFLVTDVIAAAEAIQLTLELVFEFKGIEYKEIDLYSYVIDLLKANRENTDIGYGNANNKFVPEGLKNEENLAKIEARREKERQKEIDEIDRRLNFSAPKDVKLSRSDRKRQGKLAAFALKYDIDFEELSNLNPDLSNKKEVLMALEVLASEEVLEEYLENNGKGKKKNRKDVIDTEEEEDIEDFMSRLDDIGRLDDIQEINKYKKKAPEQSINKGADLKENAVQPLTKKEVKAARKADKLARKNLKKTKIVRELDEELLNLVDDINSNKDVAPIVAFPKDTFSTASETTVSDDFMSDIEKRIDSIMEEEDLDFSDFREDDIVSFDDLQQVPNEQPLTGKDYLADMLKSEFNTSTSLDKNAFDEEDDSSFGRSSFDKSDESIYEYPFDHNDLLNEEVEEEPSISKYKDGSVFGDENFLLSNAKENAKKATDKEIKSSDIDLTEVDRRKGVVIDTTLLDDVITADKEFASASKFGKQRIKNHSEEIEDSNIHVKDDFNVSLESIHIDEENTLTSVELEKIRSVIDSRGYNNDLNNNLSITLFNSGYINDEVFHIYNLKNNIDSSSKFRSLYAILYNALQKSHVATVSTYIKSKDLGERELSEVYKYQMLILSLIKNGTLNDYNWNINMIHGSTLLMSYAVKDILNSVSHIAKFIGETFETPKVEIRAKNEIKLLYVNVSFNVKLIDRDIYAILNTKFKSGEDFIAYNKWIEKPVRYVYHKKGFTHQQINSLRLLAYDLLGSYSLSENQINYIIASLDPTYGNVVAIDDYIKNKPLALFTIAILQPKLSVIVVKDVDTADKYERILNDLYLYTSVANLGDVRSNSLYHNIDDIVNTKPQIILTTPETFQIYEFKRLVKKLDDSKMIGAVIVDNAEQIPQRGHTSRVSLLLLTDTLNKIGANAKRIAVADVLQNNVAVDLVSEFNLRDSSEIITVEKYEPVGQAVFVSAVYDLNREIDPLRRTVDAKEVELLYRKELNHIIKLYKELSNQSGKVKIVCAQDTKIGNERALYILHKLGVVGTWELSFDDDKIILNVISNPNFHSFYYIKKTIEEYINSYTLGDEILLSLKSCASMGELITLFYEWYVYTFINPDLKTDRRRTFEGILTQSKLSEGNPIKHQVTVLEQKFRALSDGNYNMSFDGYSLNDVIKLASSLEGSLLEEKKHEVEVMLGILIRKLTVYHSIISLRLGEFDESNARDGLIYALNTLDAGDLRAVYRDLAYLYEKLPTAQKIALIDVLLEVDKDALYKLINIFKNDKVIYSFIVKHISSKINL